MTETTIDYRQIITIEKGKRSGKPCIRGLRITVDDILDCFASGMTEEEVLNDYDYLTKEDIRFISQFRPAYLKSDGKKAIFSLM